MSLPLFQIDAFAERPFQGNPAAVCFLAEPMPDVWMQNLAQEMNLAETAFLLPEGEGYRLRWFTPLLEVDLCGHATLASAHALWESGALPKDRLARFYTRSGELVATRSEAGITLDFPIEPPEPAEALEGMLEAIGLPALTVQQNRWDYLVRVESAQALRSLEPDMRGLSRLAMRGLIVTALSDTPEYDFISRFFAPGSGINEDPVTGSAHCTLAPFWSPILGKTEFRAYQASARGGALGVQIVGNRIMLRGKAATVFEARLFA